MKILIADDDFDARNILKLIIEMHGHEAIEASDGLQGLEKTKADRPDIIISDILMPRMDGFQFLREANSDKNLSAIPFVFYSSTYAGEEEIELAFSSGADGFIVKPKSPEKFWEELNNILSKREEEKSKKTKPIKDEEYLRKYSHVVSAKLKKKVKELEDALAGRKTMEEKIFEISQDWEHTFNSITDMVTVHDKDWNIIRANKAAEKILGLPFLEKTADTKCFKYYHGTEKPPEGCPSCSCLKTGESATFELFEPHLNMFIEIRAIPRFDSNNQLIGLIHVVRDITERKKAEEKLNQFLKDITRAKTEWEITFDNVTEFIVLVDKDFRIVRCNKVFAEFSDKQINEIPGNKFTDIFPMGKEDAGYLAERIQKRVFGMDGGNSCGKMVLPEPPACHDPDSLFLYSVIIATDITALKSSEQKLMESEGN